MRLSLLFLLQLCCLISIPTVFGRRPSHSWRRDPPRGTQTTDCSNYKTLTAADFPNWPSEGEVSEMTITFEAARLSECDNSNNGYFFGVTNMIEGQEKEIFYGQYYNPYILTLADNVFSVGPDDDALRLLDSTEDRFEITTAISEDSSDNYEIDIEPENGKIKVVLSVDFANKLLKNWILSSEDQDYIANEELDGTAFNSGAWRFDSTFKIYLGASKDTTDTPVSFSFYNLRIEYKYMNQLGNVTGAAEPILLAYYPLNDKGTSSNLGASEGSAGVSLFIADSVPEYTEYVGGNPCEPFPQCLSVPCQPFPECMIPPCQPFPQCIMGTVRPPPCEPFPACTALLREASPESQTKEDGADRRLTSAQPSWSQSGYLQFTNNAQYISLPITDLTAEDSISLIKSVSLTFWVKLDSTQGDSTRFVLLDDATDYHLAVYRDSTTGYIAYEFASSSAIPTTTSVPLGEWTLISLYYGVSGSDATLTLYVNDIVAYTSETSSSTTSIESAAKFLIGGFVGEIRDLYVYGPGSQPTYLSTFEPTPQTATAEEKGNVVVIAVLCSLAGLVLFATIVYLAWKKQSSLKAAKNKSAAYELKQSVTPPMTPTQGHLKSDAEAASPF